MSDMARKARLALKAKAKALAGEKDTKVDSSDWKQAEPLNADVKTGARPVSRRAFKKGGKVEGEKAKANMGKKQRAMGGSTPRSFANAKINRNVKDANEERLGKKHIGAFKKGGRARHGYATDGAVSDEDRAAMTRFIEEKALDRSPSEGLRQVGKGVKSREVEAFDLYDPEQLKRLERGYKKGGRAKRAKGGSDGDEGYFSGADKTASDTAISRALREHGNTVKKINGVIHGIDPDGNVSEPIGNDVKKLKNWLGYSKGGRAKKNDGGGAGMRSERTVAAKAQRNVMDKSDDFNQFESKYGNSFRIGDKRATEYADKAAKYGASQKAFDRALEERGPLKKGGRAKKQMGGAMMMDPRLGMVKPTAFEFTNGTMVPGLKKGGKAPSYKEMREKAGTQVMKKGGKAHSDEAMDRALIKKMVKAEARKGRASGGRQSFTSAFAEARKNGMDLFEWNGKLYNTKLAESPKTAPMPPRRPGSDIGAGERPEQSGRELMGDAAPRRRSVSIDDANTMGLPIGVTRDSEETEGRSLRQILGDAIGIRGRDKPMFSRGSGSEIYSGPRDTESGRKKGGRAKRACGGYAGGGMAEQGGKRGKKGSGKTNINIVIAAGKPADQQGMMPPAPPPGMMPPPPPGGPMGGPPMPPPDMGGGMAPPPMGRKRGGRAGYAAGGAPAPMTPPITNTPTTGGTARQPTVANYQRPGSVAAASVNPRGPAQSPRGGANQAQLNALQQQVAQMQAGGGRPANGKMPSAGGNNIPPSAFGPPPSAFGPGQNINMGPNYGSALQGQQIGPGVAPNPAVPSGIMGGPTPFANLRGQEQMLQDIANRYSNTQQVGGAQGPMVGIGGVNQGLMQNAPSEVLGRYLPGDVMNRYNMGSQAGNAGAPTPMTQQQMQKNVGTPPVPKEVAYMNAALGRKSGGRVSKVAKSYQDMEAGAGSGEGRLQKTDIAKKQPKPGFSKGENVYEGRGYPNKVLGATGGRTARKEGGPVKKR